MTKYIYLRADEEGSYGLKEITTDALFRASEHQQIGDSKKRYEHK